MRTMRNYLVIIVILFFVLIYNINTVPGQKPLSSPSLFEPTLLQQTFDASMDTYVTGSFGNAGTNFGTAQSLTIGRSGTMPFVFGYHTLVDFDLSNLPPDAEIVSATLGIYTYFNRPISTKKPNAEIIVYSEAITESWGEFTATWYNRPASSSQGDPANPVDGITLMEEWDVTKIVTAWTSGALTQNGIKLFSTSDSAIATFPFYSREGGIDPQLTISYTTAIPTETPTPTVTYTPTPTLPSSGSCPGYVNVFATSDTYTDSSDPTGVYGSANGLALSNSPNTLYTFLNFPVEQVIPADQHIYSASLYLTERNDPEGDTTAPWSVFVYTLHPDFNEGTTNWNNQPAPFLGSMEQLTFGPTSDVKVIYGLEYYADLWHQETIPNQGLGISLQDDNTLLRYFSREAASEEDRPYLRIKCGGDPPTPTPTPTDTPTPTPTPTNIPKTINYRAKDLEVTQGIQNISNSVRLVDGKRTFVRFYVDVFDTAHFDGKIYSIDAELRAYRGTSLVDTLLPVNTPNGYLDLPYGWEDPFIDPEFLLMVSDNTFIFEIPSSLTNGTLRLVGDVNIDWKYPETNWIDNEVEVIVDFETVPQVGLHITRVQWQDTDNTYYTTSMDNIGASLNYARQGLPIPDIWAQSNMYQYYLDYGKGSPPEWRLNQFLLEKFIWDAQHNGTLFQEFSIVRYYALMDKNGSQGGGLALGIPGVVASGWTGRTSTFTHELAHTFSRHHATYCGAKSGCVNVDIFGYKPCPDGYVEYPYNQGRIGPHQFSMQGFVYGNDNNFDIRSSEWKDEMTYCGPRWLSDFTYHGIMNYLQSRVSGAQKTILKDNPQAPSDNIMISGVIDLVTGELETSPFYVIPDSTSLSDYEKGDFAIVLRDIEGHELARYWFTPPLPIIERICSLSDTSAEEPRKMNFTELVPYHPQTVRVDIEGPNDSGVLASIESGISAPKITVKSPNGGEIYASDSITVTWGAEDEDDQKLFFNVQYSADKGDTWDMVAMNILDNQVIIPRDNFHGSTQALVRVYASDGIHTLSDTSDQVFTIANSAPSVEITQPVTDTFAMLNQTVAFSAFAVDLDLGVFGGDYLTWSSDIDGILGNGSQFSTADLSEGTHKITVFVNDGDGGVAADNVQVTIYADSSQIPNLPDKLKVGPVDIIIDYYDRPGTTFIQIYNSNNDNPISWSASSSESWLELSSASGTTTELVYLNVDTFGLPEGFYTATVTVTNIDNPSETIEVNVYLIVQFHDIYVPMISREP